MNSHFIIVADTTHSATAGAGTHAYYGPFPTATAAEAVLAEHPDAGTMQVVGLDFLAPVIDPREMHPNSAGV